jgi:ribosome-associated translation inhibitor RaiA
LNISQHIFLFLQEKSMIDLDEIFSHTDVSTIIGRLKERSVSVPSWSQLITEYEPRLHEIVEDKVGRRDKELPGGAVEKAARIPIGLEKLLTRRISEFTVSIPVKRVYSYDRNDDTLKSIAKAIEKIYTNAHIDAENMKRAKCLYASCEMFTLWYTQRKRNKLYGFDSEYKLKCRTFSPMDGVRIYPLFDEYEDLLALSFEYEKKVADTKITFFETFTATHHYKWSLSSEDNANGWQPIISDEISIEKIPAVYWYRNEPCWESLKPIRENIEYTISRNSDVIAYNSAPILKVAGSIVGEEHKGETRRVYRVTEDGDVSYVSWQQAIDALKYHVDTLIKLYFMQSQMPDISFENMKSLGNIGYDSRKTLLMDAHLKIGEEAGKWIEGFERESNVIKAFLAKMNTSWASRLDEISIEHVITPFIQEDEAAEIEKWMKADGNKPVISHKEAIRRANLTDNADDTYDEIQKEEQAESERSAQSMSNLFSEE